MTVDALRGRSTFAPAVQAAEHFVRLEHGLDGIDALRPLELARRADDAVTVRLAVGERVVSVVLREHESEPIERLTCSARVATPIREWELVELE